MSVEVKQLVIKSHVISRDKNEDRALIDGFDLHQQKEQVLKSCLAMIKRNRNATRER